MGIGRAGDEKRVHRGIGQHAPGFADRRAGARGGRRRSRAVDVDDVLQPRCAVRSDVRRMDPADAAGAEQREGLHDCAWPASRAVSW
jgi:hypothetical protein